VKAGQPQATATVTLLEDLGSVPPEFLDASAPEAGSAILRTIVVDEGSLRQNLLPGEPMTWPPVKDGPIEGALTTSVVVDRMGAVRELGTIVSANPILSDSARQFILAMHFKPYLRNGEPVQVVSRVTLPFKTTRPAGMESFDSARNYFERGRKVGFPADSGSPGPYVLHAEFTMMGRDGKPVTGRYTDTWVDETHWRREAWLENSHYIRSCNGEQRYRQAEGQDAALLGFVLHALEPIPAIDTFVESDWRIQREKAGAVDAIRVASGPEDANGQLDPRRARGY
jgi:Gram-negative bacterial TonB protein C-terminal